MTTRNMIHAPKRMQETWEWVNAFCAFDYGDPVPLAFLVQYEDIPPEYREALADVVSGVRKPKKRKAANLKVPANMMMAIARSTDTSVGWVEYVQHHHALDSLADQAQVEPIELINRWRERARRAVSHEADNLNVSTATMKNLMRIMRRRIDRWPKI